MSNGIEEFEDAIVAYLQAGFAHLSVAAFPERPQEYRFTHPVGTLLVHYSGADFGQTQAIGATVLHRTLLWDITVYAKSLRERKSGALTLLDALRLHLTGFRPPNASSAMSPTKEDFVNRDASAWIYVARYSFDAPLVQKTAEETAILLQRITSLDEQDGHIVRDVKKAALDKEPP